MNQVYNPPADVYVIGAGGHAREIYSYIRYLSDAGWKGALKGFLDDGLPAGRHGRLEVLGKITEPMSPLPHSARYITALGDNFVRQKIVARVERTFGQSLTPWTLVHPSSWIGTDVEIGEGTCIAPNVIITAGVRVGRHSILNVKASVSHDCSLGDFVNINPGATVCGWVTIGEGAFIGAGATIKDRINIGAGTIIGAGAVVTRDIPSGVTAVGVPARVIKTHSKGNAGQ
jgi:sugar O-acyltransferase (sialic acid O-acetyltransferase NeuD family)